MITYLDCTDSDLTSVDVIHKVPITLYYYDQYNIRYTNCGESSRVPNTLQGVVRRGYTQEEGPGVV